MTSQPSLKGRSMGCKQDCQSVAAVACALRPLDACLLLAQHILPCRTGTRKERGNCRVEGSFCASRSLEEGVSRRILSKYFVYQGLLLRTGKKIVFLSVPLLPQPLLRLNRKFETLEKIPFLRGACKVHYIAPCAP
jgi:hypothetical protein